MFSVFSVPSLPTTAGREACTRGRRLPERVRPRRLGGLVSAGDDGGHALTWRGRWGHRIRHSYKVRRLLGYLRRIRAAGGEVVESRIRPVILRLRLRHVHGPQKIPYARNELIVLCVVRDGALHVKSFLEHHLALGVAHIVLLDNGSTDATIDLARRYDRVTILRTTCPYRKYETILKRYLVNRFSRNRWSLFADIDERFDYPYSDVIDLGGLLAYLNEHSYTAVVAQMLDMFGDGPLDRLGSTPEDTLEEKYPYYDISAVEKHDYVFGRPENSAIKMHSGGVRKTVFGTENGLTKAALILASAEVVPFVGWHHTEGASIADFSCVLLHFPFVSTFGKKVEEAVRTDRYRVSAAGEYEKYWMTLKHTPDLCLKTETAKRFEGVNSLLENGFLVVSERYRRWVDAHRSKGEGR